MKRSFLVSLISTLLVMVMMTGCGTTPDFSRYRLELDMYLSGDTAICGSAALVDTTGGLRVGFNDKCFVFKKGVRSILLPTPVTGEPSGRTTGGP